MSSSNEGRVITQPTGQYTSSGNTNGPPHRHRANTHHGGRPGTSGGGEVLQAGHHHPSEVPRHQLQARLPRTALEERGGRGDGVWEDQVANISLQSDKFSSF